MPNENVTVTATFKVGPTCTVTFDANGHGTGLDSQIVASGSNVTKPTNDPIAAGYTFDGWYKEAACTNPWDFATDTVATDTTLYAKWTANSYNITYKDKDNENFSGTHDAGHPTTHTYNAATTLKGATKSGYTFGGWFTDSGCTGTAVTSLGAAVYTDNVTLYAEWTENEATLTYDANGHGTAPNAATMKYTAATNAASLTDVTGYTFNGWNTEADGTGTAYAAGAEVKAVNVEPEDTTLYAQWTENVYDIIYKDKDGAAFSGTHESGYPTTHTYDTATTLKGATKSGYTFGGWFTDSGCTGTAVTSLGAAVYTDNVTLYAEWTSNSSGRSSGAVTTVVNMPLIRTSNRGDAVKELQTKLNALGYNCGAVDGIFGSKTYAAVVAFQKAMGIGVDGIVGPETWGKLGVTGITVTTAPAAATSAVSLTISSNMPLITKGSTGDAVKALQVKLNALGYDCGKVDGIFGDKTLAAVKAYQTDKALLVDGKVGNQTWGALR